MGFLRFLCLLATGPIFVMDIKEGTRTCHIHRTLHFHYVVGVPNFRGLSEVYAKWTFWAFSCVLHFSRYADLEHLWIVFFCVRVCAVHQAASEFSRLLISGTRGKVRVYQQNMKHSVACELAR